MRLASAARRNAPPTEKQFSFAEELGIAREEALKMTRIELSRFMDRLVDQRERKQQRAYEKELVQHASDHNIVPGAKVQYLNTSLVYTVKSVDEYHGTVSLAGRSGAFNPKNLTVVEPAPPA